MKSIIHTLNINNYFPELFELSIKTIEYYANKIGADLNIITNRKYPDWPILTEKLQVYQDGIDSDWNLFLDADILVHPDSYNPLENKDPAVVKGVDKYSAKKQFKIDKYFIRDGRDMGLVSCMMGTSRLTHDLWEFPNDLSSDETCNNIYAERKVTDEYLISRNLAKYGLKIEGMFPDKDYNMFLHLGNGKDKDMMLDVAKKWMKENWENKTNYYNSKICQGRWYK